MKKFIIFCISSIALTMAENYVVCDWDTLCPEGNTCCYSSDKGWTCCPMTGCNCCDSVHCCPKGFDCNLSSSTCDEQSTARKKRSPLLSANDLLVQTQTVSFISLSRHFSHETFQPKY